MKLVFFFIGLLLAGCAQLVPVQVQTNSGMVQGSESEGIHRFLGIPYAKPPVAELRWKPPQPLDAWPDIKDATEFGTWCPQPDFERRDEGKIYSSEGFTVFSDVPASEKSDEDCLSLNIWSSSDSYSSSEAKSTSLKPVMVFIHGNALGSSYPLYQGKSFAQAGIVFVSINFRLLTLGNFAHPSITSSSAEGESLGNYTLLDQLAALDWVQENISFFGGNPDDVTVVGSSAGGASILQMLTNNQSAGLFHKAIIQSGNGWFHPLDQEVHEKLGCILASMASLNGCEATADELRQLPWQDFPTTGPYSIDGRTWNKGATEAISSGEALDIPILIGWNSFDGSSLRYPSQQVIENTHPDVLASYEAENFSSTEDLAYELYTDLHAAAPARWLAHHFEEGEPAYLYRYSYILSSEPDDIRGAQHAYELPHVFNSWDKYLPFFVRKLFISKQDLQMTNIMHQCWIVFIKQGRPNCENIPEWPEYHRSSDLMMDLTLESQVLSGYKSKQLNALEGAMPFYLENVNHGIDRFLEGGSVLLQIGTGTIPTK